MQEGGSALRPAGSPRASVVFRMMSSLRGKEDQRSIQWIYIRTYAMTACSAALPFAASLSENARRDGSFRAALRPAMYITPGRLLRPPPLQRLPVRTPLSPAISATPARAASWRGVKVPDSGISARSAVAETGPAPEAVRSRAARSHRSLDAAMHFAMAGVDALNLALQEPQDTPALFAHALRKSGQIIIADACMAIRADHTDPVLCHVDTKHVVHNDTPVPVVGRQRQMLQSTEQDTSKRAGTMPLSDQGIRICTSARQHPFYTSGLDYFETEKSRT